MIRLLLTLFLLAAACTAAAAPGPAPAPALGGDGQIVACRPPAPCRPVDLQSLSLDGPATLLEQSVEVRPEAMPLPRPLMVTIVAMASSEIYWNGVPIGRNGIPGPDSAHEKPGRFIASFTVPSQLVRPGMNRVSAKLSAHHLWLPVRRTVHIFRVGFYESPDLPGLTDYLPALLALGALAAAAAYFAAAAWLERGDRQARLLALVAAAVMLQLAAETARSFVSYPYPWHLVRVAAIAVLAAATAVLIAAYAARRFAPDRARSAPAVAFAAALASLLLVPWYDLKAIGAIVAGALVLLVCAARGARHGVSGSKAGIGFALLLFALIGWQLTDFLDQAYYLAMATILVALVGEQLLVLRHARSAGALEAERAAGLEAKLRAAGEPERIARLKDGARTHHVPEEQILFVRAADDYCEVRLEDGRNLLVTMTLSRVQQALSSRFVRIHKSYVVDSSKVAAVAPRPGGGRQLSLADGTVLPIGRAFAGAVAALG